MRLSLDNHIAGGYFLVKSVERHEWFDPDLLPERILSLSGCICTSFEVDWAWGEQWRHEPIAFGVPEDKLDALTDRWNNTKLHDDFDVPNVFYRLSTARSIAADFLPDKNHLHLIGIALHKHMVEGFLTVCRQPIYDPVQQRHEEIESAVNIMLRRGEALQRPEHVLGYEILSCSMGSIGHSWLCSGLDREMHQLFGIRPNQHGLIDSPDEAMQVYNWIAEDEQRGHRAEPEPYYPWLLVDYALDSD